MSTSSTKRHSILPPVASAGPKAPVKFSSSAIIAESAVLSGSHEIRCHQHSVIHPRAKLDSENGALDIGQRCVVHERTHIGAKPGTAVTVAQQEKIGVVIGGSGDGVALGSFTCIEVGAVIESGGTVIGTGTLVGVGSKIGSGAVIGEYCTISPRTTIAAGEKVQDYTVVYSNNTQRPDRRDVREVRSTVQARQIEILRRLIPSKPEKFQ